MKIIDDTRRLALVNDQGETLAQMVYEVSKEDQLWVTHTFTNPDYRGHGYAQELFEAMVAKAREEGRKIVSTCEYVSRKLQEDPDRYQDIYAEQAPSD